MIGVAFITGFLGSLHCLGMCGPLALAMPLPENKKWIGATLYNLGRVISYSILGSIAGVIGNGLVFSGVQQTITLVLGLLILYSFFLPTISGKFEKWLYGTKFMKGLRTQIGLQFKIRTLRSSFIAGFLNGFIPCGMVYLAMAGAIATGSVFYGTLFMMLFGVGTVPAMTSIHVFRSISMPKFRSRWVISGVSLVFGLLLIYRGIGIPLPTLDEALIRNGFDHIAVCQ